jgi:hypothetical protein
MVAGMSKAARAQEDTGLGRGFGAIPHFLNSTMLEKPNSFLRKISVLPKVYSQTGSQIENTKNVFCKTPMCFANGLEGFDR